MRRTVLRLSSSGHTKLQQFRTNMPAQFAAYPALRFLSWNLLEYLVAGWVIVGNYGNRASVGGANNVLVLTEQDGAAALLYKTNSQQSALLVMDAAVLPW